MPNIALDAQFSAKVPTDVFYVGPHSLFSYNGLLLNNRRQRERYLVEEPTGFDDADLRVTAEENPQEDGETPSPGYYGGRTMTLTGQIEAGNYPQIAVMSAALKEAFIDLVERPLTVSTYDDPGSFFLMPDVQIWARKVDKVQISNRIAPGDVSGILTRAFTISLRASNPRFVSAVEHEEILVPQVISQLGRVYDRGYDLAYTTLMDPTGTPSTAANVVTLRNTGNWPARPTYRFNGPMSGISLTNNDNGQMLRLTTPIPQGEWIEVDTSLGIVYDRFGNPAGSTLDTTSHWVRLDSRRTVPDGDNLLTLGVSTFGPGASVRIRWKDTWI